MERERLQEVWGPKGASAAGSAWVLVAGTSEVMSGLSYQYFKSKVIWVTFHSIFPF